MDPVLIATAADQHLEEYLCFLFGNDAHELFRMRVRDPTRFKPTTITKYDLTLRRCQLWAVLRIHSDVRDTVDIASLRDPSQAKQAEQPNQLKTDAALLKRFYDDMSKYASEWRVEHGVFTNSNPANLDLRGKLGNNTLRVAKDYSVDQWFFGVIGNIDKSDWTMTPPDDRTLKKAALASRPAQKPSYPLPDPKDVHILFRQELQRLYQIELPTFADWAKDNAAFFTARGLTLAQSTTATPSASATPLGPPSHPQSSALGQTMAGPSRATVGGAMTTDGFVHPSFLAPRGIQPIRNFSLGRTSVDSPLATPNAFAYSDTEPQRKRKRVGGRVTGYFNGGDLNVGHQSYPYGPQFANYGVPHQHGRTAQQQASVIDLEDDNNNDNDLDTHLLRATRAMSQTSIGTEDYPVKQEHRRNNYMIGHYQPPPPPPPRARARAPPPPPPAPTSTDREEIDAIHKRLDSAFHATIPVYRNGCLLVFTNPEYKITIKMEKL